MPLILVCVWIIAQGDVAYSFFTYLQNVDTNSTAIHGVIGTEKSEITERIGYISGRKFQTLVRGSRIHVPVYACNYICCSQLYTM